MSWMMDQGKTRTGLVYTVVHRSASMHVSSMSIRVDFNNESNETTRGDEYEFLFRLSSRFKHKTYRNVFPINESVNTTIEFDSVNPGFMMN
jgi:hypothetical protein